MFRRSLLCFLLFAGISGLSLAQVPEIISKEKHVQKYHQALEFAKDKQYTEAYETFEEVLPLAKAAQDSLVFFNASKVLAQLEKHWGVKAFYEDNYEEALKHFERGIQHMDSFTPNHEWKAKVLEQLDRENR